MQRKIAASLAATALMLGSAAAYAADQWPTLISTSVYTGQSNETAVTLQITAENHHGLCHTISGIMFDNGKSPRVDSIDGFYCPFSGRISFQRIASGTTPPSFQTYLGNVSDADPTRIEITGVFAEDANASALGEYPFAVSNQNGLVN